MELEGAPWRLAAAGAADESYTRVLNGLPQISVQSSARKSAARNQVRVASAAFASAFASAATSRAACSDPQPLDIQDLSRLVLAILGEWNDMPAT